MALSLRIGFDFATASEHIVVLMCIFLSGDTFRSNKRRYKTCYLLWIPIQGASILLRW